MIVLWLMTIIVDDRCRPVEDFLGIKPLGIQGQGHVAITNLT